MSDIPNSTVLASFLSCFRSLLGSKLNQSTRDYHIPWKGILWCALFRAFEDHTLYQLRIALGGAVWFLSLDRVTSDHAYQDCKDKYSIRLDVAGRCPSDTLQDISIAVPLPCLSCFAQTCISTVQGTIFGSNINNGKCWRRIFAPSIGSFQLVQP
jgi:hypothetical protein